jgi:hypothetical protein
MTWSKSRPSLSTIELMCSRTGCARFPRRRNECERTGPCTRHLSLIVPPARFYFLGNRRLEAPLGREAGTTSLLRSPIGVDVMSNSSRCQEIRAPLSSGDRSSSSSLAISFNFNYALGRSCFHTTKDRVPCPPHALWERFFLARQAVFSVERGQKRTSMIFLRHGEIYRSHVGHLPPGAVMVATASRVHRLR